MMNQPIHGNYHGYYTKRNRPVNANAPDLRLSVVSPETFEGKRVLDLGCNEGWVSIDIAQHFAPLKVIGVDIDGELIRAAWKRRRLVWSLQKPVDAPKPSPQAEVHRSDSRKASKSSKVSAATTKLLPEQTRASENTTDTSKSGYFPMAMEYMFGPLPILPLEGNEPSFPNNLAFYTADWTKSVEDVDVEMNEQKADQDETANELASGQRAVSNEDKEGYDIILAFSITKWIHLNGGDEILMAFFRKIYRVLRSGGIVLLEPQEWEGYAKARKMSPELAENYKHLSLRPAEFPKILTEIGFQEVKTNQVDASKKGGFKRNILVLRKT